MSAPHPTAIDTAGPIPLSGTIEIDGETVKWDRNSFSGLAIEFSHRPGKPDGRVHIGGDPDVERIRLAMSCYRIGHTVGRLLGKEQRSAEFRKLIGV